MSLIRVNPEFCLGATSFLNRSNHTFRSFRRDDFVFGSDEGINRDLGQVCGPRFEVWRHIFRPAPTDSPNDRCNGREVFRIMATPNP